MLVLILEASLTQMCLVVKQTQEPLSAMSNSSTSQFHAQQELSRLQKPLSSSGGGCSWSPPGLCKTHGQGGRGKASAGADPALSYPVCKSRVAPLQPGESLSRHSGVRELETNPLWLFMFRLRENLIYQPLEPGEELGERSRRRREP